MTASGQEGHLDCWNVVHKQEFVLWKPIKSFQVPLSSLESQPHLPGVWALMVGLLAVPLSPSLHPLLCSHSPGTF